MDLRPFPSTLILCVLASLPQLGSGNILYLQDQAFCNSNTQFRLPLSHTTLKSQSSAKYTTGRDCFIVIRGLLPFAKVRATFNHFELMPTNPMCADGIIFYDGPTFQSPVLNTACAPISQHLPAPVTSTGMFMTIRFIAASGFEMSGFNLTLSNLWQTWFLQDEKCGSFSGGDEPQFIYLLPLAHGTLLSQRGALYRPNMNCTVFILATKPNQRVRLSFKELKLDGLCGDFIYIHDGLTERLHCGPPLFDVPEDIISTTQAVKLTFITDGSRQNFGFNIDLSNVYTYKCYVCNGDNCPREDYKHLISEKQEESECYACLKMSET